MPSTNKLSLLLALVLAGLLLGVSGCSWGADSPAKTSSPAKTGFPAKADGTSDRKPDSVRIEADPPILTRQKSAVTITDAGKVQQLYAMVYALPRMPEQRNCTSDAGIHYTLAFRQGNNLLVTVLAKREGCHPVSIAGEKQDRQATKDFWAWLDENTR